MELQDLRVQNYKCIDDTGWVSIENLTCLIGKNESGKTAFMEAVEALNPSFGDGEYTPYKQYPRDRWPEYKRRHDDDPAVVASARFRLDDEEITELESEYGALTGQTAVLHKDYANELHWDVPFDPDDLDEDPAAVANDAGKELLADSVPAFRYVGEYSIIEPTVDVDALLKRREDEELEPSDRVFLSLLSAAGLDLAELQEEGEWREIVTELETASGRITDEAMQYWSQKDDIKVHIRSEDAADGRRLNLRVENRTHDVSVEFDQRSRGFQLFFSSFCQIYDLKQEDDIVLLLDEPGLHLHPRARQEFLEFLEEEPAAEQTVVYTAHSPFMIDPERAHLTKMVVEYPPQGGSNITTDVREVDRYTQFPLKNVFELDLLETLLVRPQVLLVDGRPEHTYLYNISEMVSAAGLTGLDHRWTVVPISNTDNVPTFAALFEANDLDIAVLSDDTSSFTRSGARDRGDDESEEADAVVSPDRVRALSEYTDVRSPTIEDLFPTEFYLELVNRSYSGEIADAQNLGDRITASDLPGTGGVVEQVRAVFEQYDVDGGSFDRMEPARQFQEDRAELSSELSKEQ
ncbi:MAG: ATP-binding protein, partial [Natronomonas sp.]